MKHCVKVGMVMCAALLMMVVQSGRAQNNALYIHPMSLIISTAVDILPTMITVTYERRTSDQNALILSPNFIFWNLSDNDQELSLNGYGVGIGYRHYLSKEKQTHGMYLQSKINLGYTSVEYTAPDILTGIDNTASASGMGADILFYIGTKGQWDKICMFFDFGLGYSYVGYEMDTGDLSLSSSGLGWEFNLGLGYAF